MTAILETTEQKTWSEFFTAPGTQVQENKNASPEADDQTGRYLAYDGDKLWRPDTPEAEAHTVSPFADFVHASFRSLVLNPRFVCVAARSAFTRTNYRFSAYPYDLGSVEAAHMLEQDIERFVQEQDETLRGVGYSTFVASFAGPVTATEEEFEAKLWTQLQRLHEVDAPRHPWDQTVSPDPDNPHFEFSVAGRGFFVVGLHPASSRYVRRFAFPTLVFNAHFQFDELRATGKYNRMQDVVRSRDIALQGNINPNLSDFGDRSDARQYSGRKAEDGWRCPFHALWAGK